MKTRERFLLTTLFRRRLEAATTRLEDIASSTIELPQAVPGLQQGVGSLQSSSSSGTPAPLPPVAAPATPAEEPPEELPEVVEQFNNVIESCVQKYLALSTRIGGVVAEQVRPEASRGGPGRLR